MIDFNINEVMGEANFKEFYDNMSEEDLTFWKILNYMEANSDKINVITEFLIYLSTNIPEDIWFKCFIRYLKYANPGDDIKKAIDKACEILPDIKLGNSSSTVFSVIEDMYVRRNVIFTDSKLLEEAARAEYSRTNDARYMLFVDYAFIYTAGKDDEKQLKEAVKSLSEYLNGNECRDSKRCIFYLMCLALIKLAFIKELIPISNSEINDIYKECLPNGIIFDLSNMIRVYNCPEVNKIINIDSDSYKRKFRFDLLDSIDRALNDKKYSPEYPPIVQKNCLFVEIPDNPRC